MSLIVNDYINLWLKGISRSNSRLKFDPWRASLRSALAQDTWPPAQPLQERLGGTKLAILASRLAQSWMCSWETLFRASFFGNFEAHSYFSFQLKKNNVTPLPLRERYGPLHISCRFFFLPKNKGIREARNNEWVLYRVEGAVNRSKCFICPTCVKCTKRSIGL